MANEKFSQVLHLLIRIRPYLMKCFEGTKIGNPDFFEIPRMIVEIDRAVDESWEEYMGAAAKPAPAPSPFGDFDFLLVEAPISMLRPLTPRAKDWVWSYLQRETLAIWMRGCVNIHRDEMADVLEELDHLGFKIRKVVDAPAS